jgi:hypothetical protein
MVTSAAPMLQTMPSDTHTTSRSARLRPDAVAVGALLFLVSLSLCLGSQAAENSEQVLASFADGAGTWVRREWDANHQAQTAALEVVPAAQGEGNWLRLPLKLPGRNEFVAPTGVSWHGWQEVCFRVVLPADLPATAVVCIFTKDNDHLWRQVRLPAPAQRGTPTEITVPIGGPEAAQAWSYRDHERPWHPLTPRSLVEYGLAIEPDTGAGEAFEGDAFLTAVLLRKPGLVQPESTLRDLTVYPRSPRVGERFEVSFRLADDYRDPFHPDSARIEALITTPAGATETVRGFYYEGFLYDPLMPRISSDPQTADVSACLTPHGAPSFRVRYCPRTQGRHTLQITATVEGRVIALPPLKFLAAAPAEDYRGFVRRDPDHPRYLVWDDATHFWSLGLNVRSPYDTRYAQVVPYSTWRDEGLALYPRLFAAYREHGIRVVEVWMSSWWLALEWINDNRGFHGVGYYNPYRAWMLDYILEQAEANGILLILVLNNHGKFGALNDTEWARNPYNRANGGFLDSCEEYFSKPEARAAFRRTCDYIVARWGASPNLLMWKLFSEIDLTGTSYDFYTQPQVAEWHREMGAYLKQIDPYKHLTTTHWMLSYARINAAIGGLPELDVLTTDAYYQGGGTAQLLDMLRGGNAFAGAMRKPLLITEYGGSPHADTMGNLIKQAHLGVWTGFFNEAPAAPMFWWFALVEEKGLYPIYTALWKFAENEDRRGLEPALRGIAGKELAVSELRGDRRLLAWGFDAAYYLSEDENAAPAPRTDVVFETPAPKPGVYTLELWDVAEGRVAETRPLTVADGQASVSIVLPVFTRDFALKLKPAAP